VASWLRRRPREPSAGSQGDQPQRGLQAAVITVYLGGAIAGGFAHDGWGPAAAAVPLGVLAGVVVVAAFSKG
jgi:hypothetical protein